MIFLVDVIGPHHFRQPLSLNKTVQRHKCGFQMDGTSQKILYTPTMTSKWEKLICLQHCSQSLVCQTSGCTKIPILYPVQSWTISIPQKLFHSSLIHRYLNPLQKDSWYIHKDDWIFEIIWLSTEICMRRCEFSSSFYLEQVWW